MRDGKSFGVLFVYRVDERRGERRATGFNHYEPSAAIDKFDHCIF